MPDVLALKGRKPAAPSRRFPFTLARLEKTEPPAVGRLWLTDEACPDLRMQVTESGAKSFYVYRKLNGRPVRVLIGAFPTVGIDVARKAARTHAAQIVQGIDPRKAKLEARAVSTFGELATDYLEMHAKQHKKSWREDQRQFETYLGPWKAKLLTSIGPADVAKIHSKLGKDNGKYVANRVLALLSAIFAFAKSARGWKGDNPCDGITKFAEVKRDRFLQPDEMPKFLEAVQAEPSEVVRDYILVSLFTGARRGNVLSMRWEDIDLAAGIWRIPDTKSGKPVVLPLVPDVVRILNERPRKNEYVFPSRVGNGHLKDPMRQWREILKRSGLKDLRLHDLRRTFGSWQAAAGVSLPIIGKSLGHSGTSATEIYSRLHLDPVRKAITAATDAMLAAGKEGAK